MRLLIALFAIAVSGFSQEPFRGFPPPSGTGFGSVTSVGLAMPSTLCSISNTPVTTTGILTCNYATGQTANRVFGTNASGNVGSFALTTAMLPAISSTLLNDQTNTPALGPGDAIVDVASNSFTDEVSATSTTTISAGQTVSWKWVGGLHVVVSLSASCSADPCASLEDQRFDSGDPTNSVGHRFAYTFTAPGTYHYYCDVHGQMMQGTVIVNGPQIPALKATTGTRYLCIDTVGNLTSSVTACSGT